jgi:hypothetical protein
MEELVPIAFLLGALRILEWEVDTRRMTSLQHRTVTPGGASAINPKICTRVKAMETTSMTESTAAPMVASPSLCSSLSLSTNRIAQTRIGTTSGMTISPLKALVPAKGTLTSTMTTAAAQGERRVLTSFARTLNLNRALPHPVRMGKVAFVMISQSKTPKHTHPPLGRSFRTPKSKSHFLAKL